MDSERTQVVWNMDEARLKELNYYMVMSSRFLDAWDLENATINLKGMHRTISGKLSDTEYKDLNKMFVELQEIKDEANKKKDMQLNSKYWNKCNDIFIEINRLCKDYGFFFREREDIGL